jgi:hypothetical protein
LVEWRGGEMEFAERGFERFARQPWYAVRYRGGFWDRRRWNYIWIDYLGVPHLYLTRKRAQIKARAWKRRYRCEGHAALEVEVVRVGPLRLR